MSDIRSCNTNTHVFVICGFDQRKITLFVPKLSAVRHGDRPEITEPVKTVCSHYWLEIKIEKKAKPHNPSHVTTKVNKNRASPP